MQTMLEAYLECALWSSTDNADESGGEPLDKNYTRFDLAPEAQAQAYADCRAFVELCAEAKIDNPQSDEQIGHDFWLTRNGHGAGFWDRGLGALGDQLTKIAKTFGSCDLYVGDDGKLYFT